MASKKVYFKVEKGDTFTIDDFRKVLGDEYLDSEKRMVFAFAVKIWKERGYIEEMGTKKSSNEKGFGRPKKVYMAMVRVVFQIGSEGINNTKQ